MKEKLLDSVNGSVFSVSSTECNKMKHGVMRGMSDRCRLTHPLKKDLLN